MVIGSKLKKSKRLKELQKNGVRAVSVQYLLECIAQQQVVVLDSKDRKRNEIFLV